MQYNHTIMSLVNFKIGDNFTFDDSVNTQIRKKISDMQGQVIIKALTDVFNRAPTDNELADIVQDIDGFGNSTITYKNIRLGHVIIESSYGITGLLIACKFVADVCA